MNQKEQHALLLKSFSIFLIILVIITFYMFFARKIDAIVFWIVVILCAVSAYWIIPNLRKKIEAS